MREERRPAPLSLIYAAAGGDIIDVAYVVYVIYVNDATDGGWPRRKFIFNTKNFYI